MTSDRGTKSATSTRRVQLPRLVYLALTSSSSRASNVVPTDQIRRNSLLSQLPAVDTAGRCQSGGPD